MFQGHPLSGCKPPLLLHVRMEGVAGAWQQMYGSSGPGAEEAAKVATARDSVVTCRRASQLPHQTRPHLLLRITKIRRGPERRVGSPVARGNAQARGARAPMTDHRLSLPGSFQSRAPFGGGKRGLPQKMDDQYLSRELPGLRHRRR